MAKIIEMPKLSPTMEEGQLALWHKKEGDSLEVDDLMAEVETDKATMEFRAFDRGVLLKILVSAGGTVRLGQPVAILGTAGEDISNLLASVASGAAPAAGSPRGTAAQGAAAPPVATAASPVATAASGSAPTPTPATSPMSTASGSHGSGSSGSQSAPGAAVHHERIKASPYVRKLALEHSLDLHGVVGSGPAGRVIARDLEGLLASQATARSATPALQVAGATSSELRASIAHPLSMMRKTIARRLTESKSTVPHFYLTLDVEVSELVKLREQINAELAATTAKGQEPERISLNDLVLKACAIALTRVPECNAQFTPEAILLHQRVDLSVAVSVPDGLVTPVVRDADRKGVLAIAREVRELAARARARRLSPEEMTDGTFSVSNLGMFGIDSFSAVINPPEGAILAVGQVRAEPVVRGDRIEPGKKMAMTMSCDHRVIDGATGARFLASLRGLLEHPLQILVGG